MPSRRDGALVAGVALAARIGVVVWAAGRFPPTADGVYYEKIARRIAEGHGYTWLWPDGAVTYAAHYPVGYPAIVALGYVVFGAHPAVAMALNALLGAAGAVAVWSLVRRAASPPLALAAGIATALHPALLPYTAAVMTEGPTASLLAIAAALAAEARDATRRRTAWLVATGIVMGVATLVRPQSLALAPVLGALAWATGGWRRALGGAAIVSMLTVLVCAPWTARNCVRMNQCALVSVNGGWNLAIGTQTESGAWHEIAVPDACKTVFEEAAKDACFGREAMKAIAEHPFAWARRAPAKLHATFDYFGAAPWYLNAANAEAFPYGAKVALGTIETLAARLFLAAALVTAFVVRRARGAGIARRVLAAAGLVACVLVHGWIGYVFLAFAIGALGRSLVQAPLVWPFTAATILVTGLTHAVFFGAGRYGLVVVPFVTALAFARWEAVPLRVLRERGGEPMLPGVDAVQAIAGASAREESPSSTERDAG